MMDRRYFQSSFVAIILTCSFVLLPVGLSHAGLNRWTAHGPAGGPISDIAIDPKNPVTLYAGTLGGGLFKSIDGGMQWVATGKELSEPSINVVTIDPLTSTTLFIGTNNGIFKSVDAGETWTAVYTGFLPFPAPRLFPDSITVLAIDPQTPTTLYAGSGTTFNAGTLIKSSDGGATWTKIENGLSDAGVDLQVAALALHPLTPSILYVAINQIEPGAGPVFPHPVPYGLFKSVDAGATWTRVQTDFPSELFIYDLSIDPQSPMTLYVGTNNGVFVSKDGGSHWTPVNNGLEGTLVRNISIDRTNPTRLYAVTELGVFRSANGGSQWESINTGLPATRVHRVVIDPSSSTTLYVGTERGLYKSTNAGQHWQASDTGIANANAFLLLLDPTTPSTLYTATFQGFDPLLFKSTTGGTSWIALPPSPLSSTLRLQAITPTTPTTLYVLTADGADPPDLLKSQDGGQSWELVSGDLPVRSLVVDLQVTERLYAYGDFGLLRSTDGGKNWTSHNSGLPDLYIGAFAIDPVTTTTLYLGSGPNGIFKSTDRGDSWSPINTGLLPAYFSLLMVDPISPNTLYAVSDGFFKSTDAGATWKRVSFPNDPPLSITRLVIDPTNSLILYAATQYDGIWKSADGGASWAPMNTGLTNHSISALVIDPSTGKALYAAAQGGGVFDFEIGPTAVDLAITQQDSPDPVFRGADLTYNLLITNNGPSAVSGAQVQDSLSPDVSLVSLTSGQGHCRATAIIGCSLGSLASGASATVQIVVKPTIAGELHNTVSITGIEPDPVTANNVVSITTTVVPPPGPDLTGTWLQVTQKCKGKTEPQRCKIKGRLLVHNQGVHDAPASTLQIRVWIPVRYFTPQPLAQFTIPPLKAGKKKKFKLTVFSPERRSLSGQYLAASFDSDNSIDEMDENNNWVSTQIP